jgi:hypothetical protein
VPAMTCPSGLTLFFHYNSLSHFVKRKAPQLTFTSSSDQNSERKSFPARRTIPVTKEGEPPLA